MNKIEFNIVPEFYSNFTVRKGKYDALIYSPTFFLGEKIDFDPTYAAGFLKYFFGEGTSFAKQGDVLRGAHRLELQSLILHFQKFGTVNGKDRLEETVRNLVKKGLKLEEEAKVENELRHGIGSLELLVSWNFIFKSIVTTIPQKYDAKIETRHYPNEHYMVVPSALIPLDRNPLFSEYKSATGKEYFDPDENPNQKPLAGDQQE